MRVIVAGGSGALGRPLTAELAEAGHDVVVLTRSPGAAPPGVRTVAWDAQSQGPWADELVETDAPVAVVNLAGKLVDCRPTAANIAALRDSRVDATRALVQAASRRDTPVAHWVQSSTTAIYADAGEERITEASPIPDPGLPQMTGVARPWEEAAADANADHLVVLRSAIVLDRATPALGRLLGLVRVGLGGTVGSGRQWFSWIHIDDWLAVVRASLGLDPVVTIPAGPLIVASDHPVRNAELMRTLRRAAARPLGLPAPAPLFRLGALALGSDPALALTGRHCTSTVLRELGWPFAYPTLAGALGDLLGRDASVSG